ncbi:MAG: glycosyltransferase family 1 protein [Patescibacteria group bacterium]
MRIAIDARMMGAEKTRGIGRYIEELVAAMLDESEHTFVLIVRELEGKRFIGHPRIEQIVADVPWYSVAEQVRMPAFYREAHADFVHVPHWNVPMSYQGPLVLTMHDLILRHQPLSAKTSTRHPWIAAIKHAGYRAVLGSALKKAQVICVPTQYVAEDIQRYYPVPSERLVVTGEGVTAFPAPDMSRVPEGRFLLYVGAAYPHKRLDLLLAGWKELATRHQDVSFVIAGEKDVFMARLEEEAIRLHLPRMSFLGRVTNAELAGLYKNASAFVFPSSDEGFGLSPLEALSLGCPVVASDAACLPEVLAKTRAHIFRNGDVSGMISAIDAILVATNARHEAEQSWHLIKESFSWKSAARKTLAAYERVVPNA